MIGDLRISTSLNKVRMEVIEKEFGASLDQPLYQPSSLFIFVCFETFWTKSSTTSQSSVVLVSCFSGTRLCFCVHEQRRSCKGRACHTELCSVTEHGQPITSLSRPKLLDHLCPTEAHLLDSTLYSKEASEAPHPLLSSLFQPSQPIVFDSLPLCLGDLQEGDGNTKN